MMGDDGEMEMGKLRWEMMGDGEMIGDDGNRGTSARLREGSAPGASASAPRRRFKPKKKKKTGWGRQGRKAEGGRTEGQTDGRTNLPTGLRCSPAFTLPPTSPRYLWGPRSPRPGRGCGRQRGVIPAPDPK